MPARYITEHSNQLHQLLVSVSRHFYVQKNGMLKYQEKPVEVNIKNYTKSKKEHLVYCILRDHFSGSFVLEVATTNSLIPLADFLYYGWSNGTEGRYLWGLPDFLYVPQLISSPELFAGLKRLGVEALNPPSGFASGMRIVRDIEDQINFYVLGYTVDHRPENISRHKEKIYEYMLNLNFGENKFKKWQDNLPAGHPKKTPEYKDFVKCFAAASGRAAGIPVVNPSPAGEFTGLKKYVEKPVENEVFPIGNRKFSAEKLRRAQDLIYDAWETDSRQRRLDLARRALKTSPYCADAYVLLAEESRDPQEVRELYEKGVQAGRLSLGDLFFKKNAGNFWLILETRPYMRALAGLADCLWKTGQRRQAIGHYKEALRLNPNDNQGIRYILAGCLLEEGMDDALGALLNQYEGDISCFMHYNRALWSFRTSGGSNEQSDAYLAEALESNSHVPAYLLGKKKIPYCLPDYYALGSEEEAMIYAEGAKKAWQKTPAALAWLAGHLPE
ncbi:MAG TPA: hypothetical protein PK728_06175 [Bacillota bacterium]|nr:hypothetical protein [Bacillota bacterium]